MSHSLQHSSQSRYESYYFFLSVVGFTCKHHLGKVETFKEAKKPIRYEIVGSTSNI